MKHFKDKNNNVFAYEDDGSQDHLIPKDYISITEQEAEEINFIPLNYKQKRQAEYGSAEDMIEYITENGLEAWQSKVQEIKTKYPKENS